MNRLDHVFELAKSSQQVPLFLSLLGLFAIRFCRDSEVHHVGIIGDNVPTTLIEGLGR